MGLERAQSFIGGRALEHNDGWRIVLAILPGLAWQSERLGWVAVTLAVQSDIRSKWPLLFVLLLL